MFRAGGGFEMPNVDAAVGHFSYAIGEERPAHCAITGSCEQFSQLVPPTPPSSLGCCSIRGRAVTRLHGQEAA